VSSLYYSTKFLCVVGRSISYSHLLLPTTIGSSDLCNSVVHIVSISPPPPGGSSPKDSPQFEREAVAIGKTLQDKAQQLWRRYHAASH
jgi:hypothetical protein